MFKYTPIDPKVYQGLETIGGWIKCSENPLIGPTLGPNGAFDGSVLRIGDEFWIWFSWRDLKSIGFCRTKDGIHMDFYPEPVLTPDPMGWDKDVNRIAVIREGNKFKMWYSGQDDETMRLGFAESTDGIHWTKYPEPVLVPEGGWEKQCIMCPFVMREEVDGKSLYRMWYSAGHIFEPDAIGYATSNDGIHWQKHPANPIFSPGAEWEKARVTACDIQKVGNDYYLFYIGFRDEFEGCCIGVAKSKDGISGWVRHPENPIIRPGKLGSWDDCNIYKPFICRVGDEWYMWYNASFRNDAQRKEQIGLATCSGFKF